MKDRLTSSKRPHSRARARPPRTAWGPGRPPRIPTTGRKAHPREPLKAAAGSTHRVRDHSALHPVPVAFPPKKTTPATPWARPRATREEKRRERALRAQPVDRPRESHAATSLSGGARTTLLPHAAPRGTQAPSRAEGAEIRHPPTTNRHVKYHPASAQRPTETPAHNESRSVAAADTGAARGSAR